MPTRRACLAVGRVFALCSGMLFGGGFAAAAAATADEPQVVRHYIKLPPFEGDRAREREYYEIVSIPVPASLMLDAAGVDVLPGRRLAVSSRRGEIWLVDGAFESDLSRVRLTLFATGLHEPLSVCWRDGWLYVTERTGITRLRDTDGDDRSDEAEIVSADWGFSGDSHEYAFSSRPDRDGSIWTALCLTASVSSKAPWRGWVVRTTPDGKMIPTAAGIRSPGGVGFNAAGDCFATDNQGYWVGSSALRHIRPGTYHGAVPALDSWELTGGSLGPKPVPPSTGRPITDHLKEPRYLPPAVILPHARLGISPTGIDYDASGKFGPFGDQLFVGEHTLSHIQRVFLEQVDGLYQGAAFPFFYGLESGPLGLRFGDEGSLFICGSDRGWGARGGKPFHFERLRWKGRTPFEIESVRIWARGFDLTFTTEVDPVAASARDSYALEAWTYLQSTRFREYGSEELETIKPVVTAVTVAPDRKRVRLTIDALKRGHVHELKLSGVRDARGGTLLHPIAWYTVNAIPRDTFSASSKVSVQP